MQNRHDMQMLSFTNENEKILQESQARQSRSLMGNVAHDLKVPASIRHPRFIYKYIYMHLYALMNKYIHKSTYKHT
jgi:hypothetical protein